MGFEPPRFLKPGDTVECIVEGVGNTCKHSKIIACMYALLRWHMHRKYLSEFLEFFTSDNEVICINVTRYTLID